MFDALELGFFVSPFITSHLYPGPPLGPGNSGVFNFSNFKARVKAPPCGAKLLVKSLLKAPALRGLTKMRSDDKRTKLFE